MRSGLIIFIKNPEIGHVKTRLARSIGDAAALDVYMRLLQHTREITRAVDASRFLFYASKVDEHDAWDPLYFTKRVQVGDDLGARMANAFTSVLQLVDRAVIIGSDCIELTASIISRAFIDLATHDAVIGPAQDGGYYLLGLKRFRSDIFTSKQWSTSTVLSDTIADFRALGLSYTTLPVLSDIDDIDDLQRSTLWYGVRGE